MLGLKISKRESICKNDYSLWNNTNDKLEYIYQLPNIPTSLQTKTEFMTNNIAINITENKHKLKQSKFVSKTEKDPSVRQLAENNTNNNMIVKTKIKYISNHKDRVDIQLKEGRNSSDFDKERTLSQLNDNNNTNISKSSPFPISQSNHTPTPKSKKVTARNIQMNYFDEKYSSAGNTNIYNDGSKDININISRSREKSNQDEIFNHRQRNVDHNNNMIMKKKVDYNTNNNDRANLKTNEGCNNSKCNKIKTLSQNPNNNNTNIANNNSMVSPFVTSSSNNIVPRPLKKYRKKEVINKLERRKSNLNSKPVDSLYNTNIDTPKCN